LQGEPYWKPFFDGFKAAHAWLNANRPDAVVVIYNDHGLNFFFDKLPTFAVGAAIEYWHADEDGVCRFSRPFAAIQLYPWHIIDAGCDEFDVTSCQEMLVDHAFTIPLALLWPAPISVLLERSD
jgi:protocatechuate 4,5-dioxygenase beta chain